MAELVESPIAVFELETDYVRGRGMKPIATAEIGAVPLLEAVSKEFAFQPEAPVKQFLNEHSSLSKILVESVPHLRACFGSGCILSLKAPMDEVGSRTLYAVVQWSGKVDDVRAALTKFDDTWWMARSRQAAGYLTFTYELV